VAMGREGAKLFIGGIPLLRDRDLKDGAYLPSSAVLGCCAPGSIQHMPGRVCTSSVSSGIQKLKRRMRFQTLGIGVRQRATLLCLSVDCLVHTVHMCTRVLFQLKQPRCASGSLSILVSMVAKGLTECNREAGTSQQSGCIQAWQTEPCTYWLDPLGLPTQF
jgi:hypothetical protein